MRKGVFSFIIGFIITIILGVVLAFIFADVTEQSYFIYGGIPLSWLHFILGFPGYDYFAFVLDLLFWWFIAFLIMTRKRKVSYEKSEESAKVVDEKPYNELVKIVLISCFIGFAILFLTLIVGLIIVALNDPSKNIFKVEIGFPLSWLKIAHLSSHGDFIFEVSNWLYLIFDFLIYLGLCFGFSYFYECYIKKRSVFGSR
ncbi:MAG: hypothetical protein JXA91_02575 [Candidatus Thermoplasmatota archaeon]|nr:hypothetical protein [Candidatus Thermoplasmatota archaeon]